ncbi:F0F1 ATP synthase subunit B [Pontiellaceae bacterium B12227]|nr:F0F1 ATP synthase subunit B [Pontiellaceae bacterium B12227]
MADSAHKTEVSHDTVETTQAHIGHGQDAHAEINPMEISGQMVVWTWVLFFITLGALYKVAWKPILGTLDKREEEIQESIDNAEVLRNEMAQLEAVKAEQLAEADAKSKKILETARNGAQEQAKAIEEKARDEAAILTENAHRDIDVSRALAEDGLRLKSAVWARELAGKLIDENLDDDKNRALTDKLIEEL